VLFVVNNSDGSSKELRFTEGPINIGRHSDSQIFLSSKAVSRHHAVIFQTQDGKWMVEDLDSSNKTYLNDKAIHKAEIKTGDTIGITNFTIEVDFEDSLSENETMDIDQEIAAALENPPEETIEQLSEAKEVAEESADEAVDKSAETTQPDEDGDMEDTMAAPLSTGPQIVARKIGAEKSPAIRFPGERAVDYLNATAGISQADSPDNILLTLLEIMENQFDARHVWCALRQQPSGPMTLHAGRDRDGNTIELDNIQLGDKVTESVEKEEFLLFVFSRTPNSKKGEGIRSALIAPVMGSSGCFGLLYLDNAIGDDHYSLSELDYLMLIGMHTAAKLENL